MSPKFFIPSSSSKLRRVRWKKIAMCLSQNELILMHHNTWINTAEEGAWFAGLGQSKLNHPTLLWRKKGAFYFIQSPPCKTNPVLNIVTVWATLCTIGLKKSQRGFFKKITANVLHYRKLKLWKNNCVAIDTRSWIENFTRITSRPVWNSEPDFASPSAGSPHPAPWLKFAKNEKNKKKLGKQIFFTSCKKRHPLILSTDHHNNNKNNPQLLTNKKKWTNPTSNQPANAVGCLLFHLPSSWKKNYYQQTDLLREFVNVETGQSNGYFTASPCISWHFWYAEPRDVA